MLKNHALFHVSFSISGLQARPCNLQQSPGPQHQRYVSRKCVHVCTRNGLAVVGLFFLDCRAPGIPLSTTRMLCDEKTQDLLVRMLSFHKATEQNKRQTTRANIMVIFYQRGIGRKETKFLLPSPDLFSGRISLFPSILVHLCSRSPPALCSRGPSPPSLLLGHTSPLRG